MKLEMLSNIISNLWLDDNVDEIEVQLRLDVMTSEVVLPCRNLVINGEDELKHIINDTLLAGVANLRKVKELSVYDTNIIEVRILPSYIFEYRMDVVATLAGGITI